MDNSINAPLKQNPVVSRWVWWESDDALPEGQAVCYNWNYTGDGATYSDARRVNHVEPPTTLNAQWFAGVSSRAYSANTGGRLVEIYCPGSVCNVLLGSATDTVVGVGLLTFDVTASYIGQFRYAGLPGEGSVRPLQTVTNDGSTTLCLAKLDIGEPSGGLQVVPLVADGAMATQMVGGTTLITGAAITTGHNTVTLADGTVPGFRKKYGVITAELTGYDIVISLNGCTDDVDDVSLDTVTFGQASTCLNTTCTLEWDGGWMLKAKSEDVPTLAGT